MRYIGPSNASLNNLWINFTGAFGPEPTITFSGIAPTSGTLPSGVVISSGYYWQVSGSVTFISGKISVPVADLVGVTNQNTLVWLKRPKSGDPWQNIGGAINTDGNRLESTVGFNSFSEFAIGSTTNDNMLSVNEDEQQKVYEYRLDQNYPNPFNPSTTIRYQMKEAGMAKIVVYDMLGRVVMSRTLQAGKGWNVYNFNAASMGSGVYFYRLSVGGKFDKTMKMMLLK